MFVCAVSLSQPSSREWYLLYAKCLCVLSRYLSPVVEICYILNVCVCCLATEGGGGGVTTYIFLIRMYPVKTKGEPKAGAGFLTN